MVIECRQSPSRDRQAGGRSQRCRLQARQPRHRDHPQTNHWEAAGQRLRIYRYQAGTGAGRIYRRYQGDGEGQDRRRDGSRGRCI